MLAHFIPLNVQILPFSAKEWLAFLMLRQVLAFVMNKNIALKPGCFAKLSFPWPEKVHFYA
jgi:hypothetical protein